jgi:hypothetical protein
MEYDDAVTIDKMKTARKEKEKQALSGNRLKR